MLCDQGISENKYTTLMLCYIGAPSCSTNYTLWGKNGSKNEGKSCAILETWRGMNVWAFLTVSSKVCKGLCLLRTKEKVCLTFKFLWVCVISFLCWNDFMASN